MRGGPQLRSDRLCAATTWLLLLVLSATGGCAWKAERIAERATPTGVEATLEMLAEPENRKLLADLAAEVASEATVRSAARGAVGGAMESIADPQAMEALTVLWRDSASATLEGIGQGLEQYVEPRMASLVGTTVERALQTLTEPHQIERIEQAIVQTTQTLVNAVAQAMADAVVEEIGPAVQATLREHVTPSVQQMITPDIEILLSPQVQAELQDFAAETSRLVSREVVLGMNEAVEQRREAGEPIRLPGMQRIGGWMDRGVDIAIIVAVVLALGVGVLALILGIVLSRAKGARVASEWRLATALLLTQSLRSGNGRQIDPELVDRLVDQLQEAQGPESIIHALKHRVTREQDLPAEAAGQKR